MSEAADQESKTEEATEKRLSEARDKGQLPFSRDIPLLLNSVALWIAIVLLLGDVSGRVGLALRPLWEWPADWLLVSSDDASSLLLYVAANALSPLLPVLGLLCAAGVLGALVQSKGFAGARIKPQVSHVSPASGWRRLFGKEGIGHTIKSIWGLLLVGFSSSIVLLALLKNSVGLLGAEPEALVAALPDVTSRLLFAIIATMGAVASADVVLTRIKWKRRLRMSKQEVKDETKEIDGDPQVKLRMRMISRRRIRKRMMANVPRATVVITNPTHYAVALRYVAGETPAPLVVAKGTDLIALRIREIAAASQIPQVEDRPLARALYSGAEVGAAIPAELYRTVARIILFVDKAARTAGRA